MYQDILCYALPYSPTLSDVCSFSLCNLSIKYYYTANVHVYNVKARSET
jgi:hypothetical protein